MRKLSLRRPKWQPKARIRVDQGQAPSESKATKRLITLYQHGRLANCNPGTRLHPAHRLSGASCLLASVAHWTSRWKRLPNVWVCFQTVHCAVENKDSACSSTWFRLFQLGNPQETPPDSIALWECAPSVLDKEKDLSGVADFTLLVRGWLVVRNLSW